MLASRSAPHIILVIGVPKPHHASHPIYPVSHFPSLTYKQKEIAILYGLYIVAHKTISKTVKRSADLSIITLHLQSQNQPVQKASSHQCHHKTLEVYCQTAKSNERPQRFRILLHTVASYDAARQFCKKDVSLLHIFQLRTPLSHC